VTAAAVDHDGEVIGVPDQPPAAPALFPALVPLPAGSHLLPAPGEVVIQRRQRDAGPQRGRDPALRGGGVSLFLLAVGRHDPGFEERLDQRAHPLVRDPPPQAAHQRRMINFIEAGPEAGFQHPLTVPGC
jgi:hypothetical protein